LVSTGAIVPCTPPQPFSKIGDFLKLIKFMKSIIRFTLRHVDFLSFCKATEN